MIMGKVQIYNGKVLFVGGKVATHEDCCCGEDCPEDCSGCSETTIDISGLGISDRPPWYPDFSVLNGQIVIPSPPACSWSWYKNAWPFEVYAGVSCLDGTWFLNVEAYWQGANWYNFHTEFPAANPSCPGGTYNLDWIGFFSDPGWNVSSVVS